MAIFKRVLIALTLLWCVNFYAQDSTAIKYTYNLTSLGVTQVKNSYLSPLTYMGNSLKLTKGSTKIWDKQAASSHFNINLNAFSHTNKKSFMAGMGLAYNYNRYYKMPELKQLDGLKLYLGGGGQSELEFVSHPNNINTNLYYCFNNMLQLGIFVINEHNGYYFSNELTIPIIGLYSTSEYASSFPLPVHEEELGFADAFTAGSLGTNSIIKNSFNFDVDVIT